MLMLAMLLMSRCEVSLRCPTISGIKEATLGNLMAIFIESCEKKMANMYHVCLCHKNWIAPTQDWKKINAYKLAGSSA